MMEMKNRTFMWKKAPPTQQSTYSNTNKNKRKHEEQELLLQKETSCSLNSGTLKCNFGIPLSKYARHSAASIYFSSSDNKTVKDKNITRHDQAICSSSDQLHVFRTSSVMPTNTTSLLSSLASKGATYLRSHTAFTPNMVPNVAAMFLAASQYYKTFGVFPQFNPMGYASKPAPTAVPQQTLPPLSCQPMCFKTSSGGMSNLCQSKTATPSAGPSFRGATVKNAAMVGHPRQWEFTDYGNKHHMKAKEGSELSVMSYNILAQDLLEDHPYLYEDRGDNALSWDYRRHRLVQEIKFHQADVVCLQEVQSNHYSDYINPELRKQGYEGVYLKRTGNKCDGCAIFFSKQKFSLIRARNVEFKRGGLLDRDNIAVILELRPRTAFYAGTVEKICVTTTHLLFNPKRGDIKMGQLMVLLAELDRCARSSDGKYAPVILCGDFNLEPYSHLYNMVCRGHLRFEGLNSVELSGQKEGFYGYRNDNNIHRDIYASLKINDKCQYMEKEIKDKKVKDGIGGMHVSDTDVNTGKLSAKRRSPNSRDKLQDFVGKSPVTGGKSREQSPECIEKFPSSTAGTSEQNTADKYRWTAHHQNTASSRTFDKRSDTNATETQISETPASGQVRHSFYFVSAYDHYIKRLQCREQEVTTQHRKAACTVDYIFYTVHNKTTRSKDHGRRKEEVVREGKLVLLARYGLMSSKEIDRIGTMPNHMMPSDHLPLISRFLLKL